MPKLTKIDELIFRNHRHLLNKDHCLFLREYTAGRGFQGSETNQLILNFKKSPLKAGTPEWDYKEQAIDTVVEEFRQNLPEMWLQSVTLVPIPPSKVESDPEYDNRMLRVLKDISKKQYADVRELILQQKSTHAFHQSPSCRPTPKKLQGNYYINEAKSQPEPKKVALFDDLINTGAHFKAAQSAILSRFPDIVVGGIFIARCIPPNDY